MASFTDKRLFGSNIPDEVIKTLQEKQNVAKEPQTNESLPESSGLYNFNTDKKQGIGGMSAETPYIRMWSALDKYSGKEC